MIAGANFMANRIYLKGVDDTQSSFGRRPYVEFDLAAHRIVKNLGKFSDKRASSWEVSGYYIRRWLSVYYIFDYAGVMYFGRGDELFVIDRACCATYERKFFYRRFEFSVCGQKKYTLFYKSLSKIIKYCVFPPILFFDLFIYGGPSDWDFDFFETAAVLINKRSHGLPYDFS